MPLQGDSRTPERHVLCELAFSKECKILIEGYMGIVGGRPAGILLATEFWIKRKGKLNLVLLPCTIKKITKSPLQLFEKCVVVVHCGILNVRTCSHFRLTFWVRGALFSVLLNPLVKF
jgi:hypothetical protein